MAPRNTFPGNVDTKTTYQPTTGERTFDRYMPLTPFQVASPEGGVTSNNTQSTTGGGTFDRYNPPNMGQLYYPSTQEVNDQRMIDYGGWAVNYDGIAERNVQRQMANMPQQDVSPVNGGGGAGGYGAAQKTANYNAYIAKVLEMLGGVRPGADTLSPRINQAVDADLAFARKTMGGVADRNSDPYAGLEFFAQQFDPGTSGMLGAQGAPGAATAQQQAGQSDQDYTAQLFNNLAQVLSANQQSSNASWNADKSRDGAAVQTEIGAQRSAMLAAAQQRQDDREEQYKQQRIQAILDLMSTGMGMDQNVSGINFGGLL